jgi:hypothetical protein
MVISRLTRAALLAGWLAMASGSTTLAQSVKKETAESCDSIFKIKGSKTASYFPGLDLELVPVPGRCFRNDGMVEFLKDHFIKLEKETDYYPQSREYILGLDGFSGMAFHVPKTKGGKEYRLTIISCSPRTPRADVDCKAHEEMHAVQFLFPGSAEAYGKLGERFKKKGYKVDFQDFDSEEMSYIAGILRVMELNMPVDKAFLESIPERKQAYEKLQKYKIGIGMPCW